MYFYLCTLLSFTGWALAGSLKCRLSLSVSLCFSLPRLTVCLSFVCFVEGAKLCSVWTGGSTRGEWTFPQAPGRAEQRVQEKCPWGESDTPPPYTVSHIHTYDPPTLFQLCAILLIFTSAGTDCLHHCSCSSPRTYLFEQGIISLVKPALAYCMLTVHSTCEKSGLASSLPLSSRSVNI